jgi:hypothetical protein
MLTITKKQKEEIAKLQEVLEVAKTLPEEARLNIEKQVMDLVEKMARLQVIKHQLALFNSGLTVGQTFTTQSSGVVGIVEEVVENATGSFRVRLNVNGVERWTTFNKELAL